MNFSHQCYLVVFYWGSSNMQVSQVSRTLFILGNFDNAVVWMVLILPLVSKSLGTVPHASTTIGITINLMFHSLFQSLAKSRYLCIFFAFFYFHSLFCWNDKTHETANSLFLIITSKSGLLTRIRWFIYISKSQRILFISFSKTDSG